MQHYELMYIVDPAAEDGLDEVKQKIEGLITGREGSVITFDKLGKKRLAYPIAKRQYGIYLLVNFLGNGKIIQAVEYYLRLSPVVLRHIILVFSDKNLRLRERTEAVLLEEAERMRLGGRPLGAKVEGEESEAGTDMPLISVDEALDVVAEVVVAPTLESRLEIPEPELNVDEGEPPAAGEAVDELNVKTME